MVLGTTTWNERNMHRLVETRDAAKERGMCNPLILDYGPGGVVYFLADLFPKMVDGNWTAWDKTQRRVVKLVENLFRKTGLFRLETFETSEIAELFGELNPEAILVIDNEKRVAESVRYGVARDNVPIPITCYVHDVQKSPFHRQGDIVFAYNLVHRTKDQQRTLDHISGSTRVGGLLSTTAETTPKGFNKIGRGLYERMN